MSTVHKNEGIIISGGSIDADALAVGKGAKATAANIADSIPKPLQESTEEVALLNPLRETLATLFNESELRDLCFQLGVGYENIQGQTPRDKAREFVLLLNRQGRLKELAQVGQNLRPHGNWALSEKTQT